MRRATAWLVVALLACAGVVGLVRTAPPQPTTVVVVDSPLALTDVTKVAGTADEVFVARVLGAAGHGMRQEVPTSSYRVQVAEALKGAPGESLTITQLGGPDAEHHHLVLVRGDRLLQPGDVALFSVLDGESGHLVIPVGGNRLLPGAGTSTTPWAQYPAVVAMRRALGTVDPAANLPNRSLPLPRGH